MTLDIVNWKAIVEALLYAAGDEGLTKKQLLSVLEVEEAELLDIMLDVKETYEKRRQGHRACRVCRYVHAFDQKGIRRLFEKADRSPFQKGFLRLRSKFSAIVSYKQPITRAEVEEIRGVKSERILQSLVAKALLCEVGRADGPGGRSCMVQQKHFWNNSA